MPLVNQISARQPSILESGTNFRLNRILDTVPDATHLPTVRSVVGARNNRGAYYEETTQRFATTIMTREANYLVQSAHNDFGSFGALYNFGLPGDVLLLSLHNIDNVAWACGFYNDGVNPPFPLISGDPFGNNLYSGVGSVLRSGDMSAVYTSSEVSLITKAADAGFLYCILRDFTSSAMVVMRCAAVGAPSNVFTSVTVTPPANGSFENAQGYGVSSDGQTQIIIGTGGTYWRSQNGGQTWSSPLTTPSSGGTDVWYSKTYRRWVISGATGGPIYSDANGGSGTWAVSSINGSTVAVPPFSVVERLDDDGRYLLAVSGYAPMQTYISEDGGKSWFTTQALLPPYYDTSTVLTGPAVTLVNTGRQIVLYQGNTGDDWNGDNGVFQSGLIHL